MRFLFASDSFKGTLSSRQTADLLTRAAEEVFGESVECSSVTVADGGEGTVEAVITAEHGEWIETEVHGPLMEKKLAAYGKLDEHRAVIEMAAASGLPLVPFNKRNPLYTTSCGTGELIRHALDQGFTDISIAIGGSATNDGGMGCAKALGVRFLDSNGAELEGCGKDLEKLYAIDLSGLDKRIRKTSITVMCDVTNPLCGPNGATYTFGAQKGATPDMQARLEAGMMNFRNIIRKQFDIDPDTIPGAGAAGGLGTALMVFLGGKMRSGIDTVLDLIAFESRLEGVDLVVTGEGRTDWQSCFGKVMQGVGERAARKRIPAVGLSGSLGKDAAQIFDHGILSLMTTVDAPMELEEALNRAEELYYLAAVRMFRFLKVGMSLR
ncbi:MAG: glycerate kinase [Oscillospiraceae bacterium]|nr:glycerate kinase [Oscillospiraceae bacterium]